LPIPQPAVEYTLALRLTGAPAPAVLPSARTVCLARIRTCSPRLLRSPRVKRTDAILLLARSGLYLARARVNRCCGSSRKGAARDEFCFFEGARQNANARSRAALKFSAALPEHGFRQTTFARLQSTRALSQP